MALPIYLTRASSRDIDGRRVADGDDFIGDLWKVHCRVKEEGYVQVCSSVSELSTGETLY